jgi:hypothetical protein
MSRHLDNLQHLVVKLEARYGQEDASVGELKAQLCALEKRERERESARVAPSGVATSRRDFSRGIGVASATRLL